MRGLRTSSNRTGRSRVSSMNRSDYVKIVVIVFLTGICLWSGIQRFMLDSTSSSSAKSKTISLSIKTNYAVCDNAPSSDRIALCKDEIDQAFTSARSICKHYLNAANLCLSRQNNNCRSEATALESCVEAVIRPTIRQWATN